MATLVQETSGSTTGTTLTLTFGAATTSANAVIIAMCGYHGVTMTTAGISLGGVASTFTKQATSGSVNCEIWANLSAEQSSTTVVITASADGIIAYAYEVSGVTGSGDNVTLDKTAGTAASSASWSSGATAATITVPEFVVGMAFLYNNAGSITGPGSGGWSNLTGLTDVAGAGGAYGGISGYQITGTTPAAYTYSGTSGTSGTWGACVATFACAYIQPGWGGIICNEHASVGYTGISATWTIPTLASESGSACSIWIGLGNVQQVGIYCTWNNADPGDDQLFLWTEYMPGWEYWNAAAYPIALGDVLTCTITLVSSTWWNITVTNSTEDWTYTQVKSIQAVNISVDAAPGLPTPEGTAEVIIEKEGSSTDPDYGTVVFTGVSTTPAVVNAPIPMITVNNGNIDQYPGPLSGGSFTMHWNAFD